MHSMWLRRGLAVFVALVGLTVTCGLTWVFLASLGDSVGTRAFRIVTLITMLMAVICGIALFVRSVCTLIQVVDLRDGESIET